jgi:hypothetical protein
MSKKIKILFLSANPVEFTPLRLGAEIRDIEHNIRAAQRASAFQLISSWSVRPHDIMESLMIHRPDVVHFSGHAHEGKLILEDDAGHVKPVEGRHLVDLLSAFSDNLKLVFLNACFSLEGFSGLSRVIDYTVGTSSELPDDTAVRFSSCFYQALAYGHTVPSAYGIAKSQVRVESLEDSEAFTLLVRDGVDDAEPFVKSARTAKRRGSSTPSEKGAKSRKPESPQPYVDQPVVEPSTLNLRGSAWAPPEIKDSLARFRLNHPEPQKVAFLMMRFGKTKAHQNIVSSVTSALDPLGITVVRADDRQYHDDLFPNVLTYIYGCGFGIAVFERIEKEEFNPNVALEVGYMFAMKKQVCLLKDKTLSTLHADLVGKLYRVFDPMDPSGSIPEELTKWLKDKGLP